MGRGWLIVGVTSERGDMAGKGISGTTGPPCLWRTTPKVLLSIGTCITTTNGMAVSNAFLGRVLQSE